MQRALTLINKGEHCLPVGNEEGYWPKKYTGYRTSPKSVLLYNKSVTLGWLWIRGTNTGLRGFSWLKSGIPKLNGRFGNISGKCPVRRKRLVFLVAHESRCSHQASHYIATPYHIDEPPWYTEEQPLFMTVQEAKCRNTLSILEPAVPQLSSGRALS